MIVSLIVAMDRNRVIGKNGKLPWSLPKELEYFRETTKGAPVIMGRKTHESIGRVLSDRTNVVITRQKDYQSADCVVVHSYNDALEAVKGEKEVFVIGGEAIYKLAFSTADRLYLTLVDSAVEGGDAFFPEYNEDEWLEVRREDHEPDPYNPHFFSVRVYERTKSA